MADGLVLQGEGVLVESREQTVARRAAFPPVRRA
jgi:hypothetical protein